MNEPRASRREFIRVAGIAVGASALAAGTDVHAEDKPERRDPEVVLKGLIEGNARYVAGESQQRARTPADFATDAKGQAPLAAIVGCADSRVPPELVFDQGVGDLFVCRAAGNLVSGTGSIVKGSLEFSVAELGVTLIMVLGHSQCGAVAAAIEHIDAKDALPGAIGPLIDLIKLAVLAAQGRPGNKLDNVIRANVERCVARVKGTGPILSRAVDAGKLKVVGGVYELSTGKVEIVA